MTKHEQEHFAELDAAVDAIRSLSIPVGPSEDLVTSTVGALQARETSAAHSTVRPTRRETMIRFAKYGTLGTAASIALLVFGSLFIGGVTGQSAFAQVVQNVSEAKSAAYSLVQKIGNQPTLQCESSYADGFIRTDIAGQFTFIANVQTRDVLQLVPSQKLAIRSKVDGNTQQTPPSIVDVMKEMTEDAGELVETITGDDGRELDVYRVSKIPSFMGSGEVDEDGTFNVWVDRETKLPTRIKLRMKMGPQGTPIEMDFDNFRWNPQFPPGHFDMVVPEGYQLQPMPAAAQQPDSTE